MDVLSIIDAVLILAGVCLVFGVVIAVVERRFHVREDPRLEAAAELLPGTNCGACGVPGCRAFAEQLVAGEKQPADCTVMGPEDVDEMAGYLGVQAGEANKRVARLLCAGGSDVAVQKAEYRGLSTCKAAAAVAGGGKGCTWGCLGLADCEVSCDFDAIRMNPAGLPVVTPELCTACNDCVEACPKDLFVIMPLEAKLIVQCKSELEGEEVESLCSVACNACGKCVVDAAPGLIEMVNGLPVIDYSKNELAAPGATKRCPTNAIVWVENTQFEDNTSTPERVAI